MTNGTIGIIIVVVLVIFILITILLKPKKRVPIKVKVTPEEDMELARLVDLVRGNPDSQVARLQFFTYARKLVNRFIEEQNLNGAFRFEYDEKHCHLNIWKSPLDS